ncbi:MAG: hypothetical protein AABY14_02055 [Nanoarchaeota archaeon]
MINKNLIIISVAIVSLLILVSLTTANMFGNRKNGFAHEQMEKMMEQGTYKDLVDIRDKSGIRVMPWVENEEDFKLAQKMHERMEKYNEESDFRMMGMHNGFQGCGMME